MQSKAWMEYKVAPEEAGMTVEQIVREKMSVSGRMLQRLTRSKGIQLNRKQPYLQRQVKAGDTVSVRTADRPKQEIIQSAGHNDSPGKTVSESVGSTILSSTLDVLYEDEYFIVVNKPSGLIVHRVNKQQVETLVDQVNGYFYQQAAQKQQQYSTAHPVHRLDKETSGAILLAKSSYAHQAADKILQSGGLHREYLALVCGHLKAEQGTISKPIARDPRHHLRRRVSSTGEAAVSHYEVMGKAKMTTWVRVWLETGKTHQIRVHFAHIGHPLAGDKLYGGERHGFRRQALHAWRLSFSHPITNKKVVVKAPLPGDMSECMQPDTWKQLNEI